MSSEVDRVTGRHSSFSIAAGMLAAKTVASVLQHTLGRSEWPILGTAGRWLAAIGGVVGGLAIARFTRGGVSEGALLMSVLTGATVASNNAQALNSGAWAKEIRKVKTLPSDVFAPNYGFEYSYYTDDARQ